MSAIKPLRDRDSSSTSNDPPGDTMRHPNDDLAADLFAAALRATEVMVRTAALKSMPQGRFIPKFELAAWAPEDMAVCSGLFEKAVDARIEAALLAFGTAQSDAIGRAAA